GLSAACREGMRKAVLSGEPFEAVEGKVAACKTETHEKMLASLTDEQRKGLAGLLGEPFQAGGLERAGVAGFAGRGCALGALPLPASAPLLGEEAVRKELKLTGEQDRQVTQLLESSDADPARPLGAEQAARLRQLQWQQIARAAGPAYLLRYRAV